MKLLKPKKLKKGDVIGLISPASLPSDMTRIEKGVKYLESLGYRVEVGKNAKAERGYLAGSDQERLDDLHGMFADKNVNAIICIRGGYGTARLLDKIDYDIIKKNPKIFCGYSDITSLQMAFLKKAGLVTFAGPMAAVDYWKDEVDPYTEEIFFRMVSSSKEIGEVKNPEGEELYSLVEGKGKGKLIGGNLAVFVALMGTKYMPDLKDSIMMVEEVGEYPYRVDRLFNQIKLSGAFEKLEGVILGNFSDCYEDDPDKASLTIKEVVDDYFADLDIPVIYNLSHGHISKTHTMPFGLTCKVNSKKKKIEIPESAVV